MKGIVIDSGAIPAVFGTPSSCNNFHEVREHLLKKLCPMVFGGDSFKRELATTAKYLGIINEFKKTGKLVTVSLDDKKINDEEKKVIRIGKNNKFKGFNDPHLIAILRISKCKGICTHDTEAHRFITNDAFFSTKKPKIIGTRTSAKGTKDILKECS